MNKLKLINSRELIKNISDTIYQNDNKITAVHISLPNKIGNYYRRTCSVELRAILPNGNYLPYVIDTNKESSVWYIENDLTERPQTVKLMMVITRAGNVIGRTNAVEFTVIAPEETVNPLTPREYADQRIAELEGEVDELTEDNQELENTIAEKDETIAEKDTEIGGLNTQVAYLQTQNAEQAQTITRQDATIDQLNSRVPKLETLDPINPSQEQDTYRPSGDNIGFNPFIVNPPTAEGLDFDYANLKKDVEFLGGVGTYDPFPYNSVGGFYITEVDEDGYPVSVLFKNMKGSTATILNNAINQQTLKEITIEGEYGETTFGTYSQFTNLRKIDFKNNSNITNLAQNAFRYCQLIEEVYLPKELISLPYGAFGELTNSLKKLWIPNKLTTLGWNGNIFNSRYLTECIFENGFQCNGLIFSDATSLSHAMLLNMLIALADRTGDTAYTLTIGSTNLNKLTAEQRAIATNKNWNLA